MLKSTVTLIILGCLFGSLGCLLYLLNVPILLILIILFLIGFHIGENVYL